MKLLAKIFIIGALFSISWITPAQGRTNSQLMAHRI
jgi:hypothetical protein